MNPARTYTSTLRADQASMTRDRIMQAAVDLLSEGDAADLVMADVAERAGTSVRTVFRNYATRDDLLDALVDWIGQHLSQAAGSRPTDADDYAAASLRTMTALLDIEPLYRALFATQAGRESHRRAAGERRAEIANAFRAELAGLGAEEQRMAAAVLHLLSSSTGALFLKDYWDLDADETGRAVQWAITALTDALRDPERSVKW